MTIGGTSPDQSTYYNFPANTSPGLGSVGSYQVAGVPYITGSSVAAGGEIEISFVGVTKQIILFPHNDALGPLSLSFASTASGDVVLGRHMLPWPKESGSALTLDVKCSSVFIQNAGGAPCDFSLYASMTGINPTQMFHLTGSGITD